MKKFIYSIIAFLILLTGASNAQYRKLHDFNIANGDGGGPHGSLIIIANILYGTTVDGGKYSDGIIYSLDTNGSGYAILHNFNDTNGAGPFYSTLTLSGNTLFGTASIGGTGGDGVIFAMHTNGSGYKVLFNFNGVNGNAPEGKLTHSGSKLYGTTNMGGTYNDGVVFSMDTNGSGYKVLLNFNDTNGSGPFGSELLLFGSKLYSTVGGGGKYKDGIVFSIDTNGNGYTDIYDFGATSTNGYGANGSLAFSGNKLFGVTQGGGTGTGGILFSIDTNGGGFNILYNVTNGGDSYCSVSRSGDILYSMTQGGPLGYGYIFSVDTDGNGSKDVFDFHDSDGYRPVECGLTISGNTIYGVTEQGGVNNDGVIFSYKDTSITTSVNVITPIINSTNVFPNPSSNHIQYSINSKEAMPVKINIYDIFGKMVVTENLKLVEGPNTFGLDISNFISGVYLLQLITPNGINSVQKKFVKE